MQKRNLLAIFLCLCLLLTACGSAPATEDNMDYGYAEMSPGETAAAGELKSESGIITSSPDTNRKLIKTVSMDAETQDYDALTTALEEKIAALAGYTESRRTGSYGRDRRWCNMTIRIPAENLSQFVAHVTENANVLATTENTQDITLQYTDTEAKITALETEQARLLELLAEAKNLSEILEIEARLSDVTYELERYASQKRSYDNQVTYATVHLTIEEVPVLTPVEEPTVWSRITSGFAESLEGVSTGIVDFFVWLIVSSPYLAVWALVIGGLLILERKFRRNRPSRKNKTPADPPPSP